MIDADRTSELKEAVAAAAEHRNGLQIIAGGTKEFLGRTPSGAVLSLSEHSGIIDYEPTELVLTARAGTTLDALEAVLSKANQMLAFEPPRFGKGATLGGTLACGLSGPRRPYAGAARDFMLGAKVLDGKGEVLTFGGQVMKNVAGYDVSRLMVGAMGTLGILLEMSLKVLPKPACEITLTLESNPQDCVSEMVALGRGPLPISGACFVDGVMWIRLAGTESGVRAARRKLGGETTADESFWERLREQTLPSFDADMPLWRLSVPAVTPIDDCIPAVIDWGGALRWLRSDAKPERLREWAASHGGHATLFRDGDREAEVFQPLGTELKLIHRRLKTAFDPGALFNPGRLYAEL